MNKNKSNTVNRNVRVADQIQKDLAELIRTEVKDIRLQGAWVTVTGVEVTPDYSHAKVFYSMLMDTMPIEPVQAGLEAAAGYLRRELGKRLVLHTTPALHFIYDNTTKNGIAMTGLIQEALTITAKNDDVAKLQINPSYSVKSVITAD
jgi:ribosome-binding factor A